VAERSALSFGGPGAAACHLSRGLDMPSSARKLSCASQDVAGRGSATARQRFSSPVCDPPHEDRLACAARARESVVHVPERSDPAISKLSAGLRERIVQAALRWVRACGSILARDASESASSLPVLRPPHSLSCANTWPCSAGLCPRHPERHLSFRSRLQTAPRGQPWRRWVPHGRGWNPYEPPLRKCAADVPHLALLVRQIKARRERRDATLSRGGVAIRTHPVEVPPSSRNARLALEPSSSRLSRFVGSPGWRGLLHFPKGVRDDKPLYFARSLGDLGDAGTAPAVPYYLP